VSVARVQDMLLVAMPTSVGLSMIARYGGDDSDFVLRIHTPKLWWPWTMSEYGEVAYLYTLHVISFRT